MVILYFALTGVKTFALKVKILGEPTANVKGAIVFKVSFVLIKSVLETNCKPEGRMSRTSMPVPVEGPALLTVIV